MCKILDITRFLTDLSLHLSDIRRLREFTILTMTFWSESVFTLFLLVCLNSWPLHTDVFHSFLQNTPPFSTPPCNSADGYLGCFRGALVLWLTAGFGQGETRTRHWTAGGWEMRLGH